MATMIHDSVLEQRLREKLDFYGKIGTRELLFIDRDPWTLELYQLGDDQLISVARLTPGQGQVLSCSEVAIDFSFDATALRPKIRVDHRDSAKTWTI